MVSRTPHRWDITNCDREPIHIPGVIQPHGFLMAIDAERRTVIAVSDSIEQHAGWSPSAVLGRAFPNEHMTLANNDWVELLNDPDLESRNPFPSTFETPNGPKVFDTMVHRQDGLLLIECEPTQVEGVVTTRYFQHSRSAVARLRNSRNLEELYENAVAEVKHVTGFDRVIIYRFDEKWNGNVLAEIKGERGDSYLNLHFPASDIPAQARNLYLLNRTRVIPDVSYRPSPLVTLPDYDKPIDLSLAVLRGVSPIHVEYLHNMEATASLSVSILKDGRLWGLISCTHLSGPRPVSFATRAVCELIGEVMSSLLPMREHQSYYNDLAERSAHQTQLLAAMSKADDFVTGLIQDEATFLSLVNARGGAIFRNGSFHLLGETPGVSAMKKIIEWMSEQPPREDLYRTEALGDEIDDDEVRAHASGLLAFTISQAQATYVMWFRPEVVQTVTWGGNPNKSSPTEGKILHPRKSFEAWKETVRGRSLPWEKSDVEAALRFRAAIINIVLLKLERIGLLNQELKRSNDELDSFAYAASHDLKEPLRGISNYSTLLRRALAPTLKPDELDRLNTIARLTQRMEDLINSLLTYSQVGRAEFAMRENDMNEVVRAALDSLKTRIDETGTKVTCDFDLPRGTFDRVQVLEIFTNLISNAIKYNANVEKTVHISWQRRDGEAVICVCDNGIGITAENRVNVFKIFRRLHARDQYGGGTGTGLTIASKIVERHGGRIWVEPNPKGGSMFCFTLSGLGS